VFTFPTASSFALLSIPIVMYLNWEVTAPYLTHGVSNPFAPMLFISHPVPPMNTVSCTATTDCSPSEDIRYRKGYLDFVFVAYYIIVWSFIRQSITLHLCWPFARYFGIKKEATLDRFGEQGYAMLYFAFFGAWGYVSCDTLLRSVTRGDICFRESWVNFRRGGIIRRLSGSVRYFLLIMLRLSLIFNSQITHTGI